MRIPIINLLPYLRLILKMHITIRVNDFEYTPGVHREQNVIWIRSAEKSNQ